MLTGTYALFTVPKSKSSYIFNSTKMSRRTKSMGRFRGPMVRELKAVSTLVTLDCNTTGAVSLLNGIAPGVSIAQRIGRQVQFARLEGHGISYVTPATGVDQTHRVMLVLDKQPNGAAPAVTDVLNTASVTSLTTLSNQKRFKVLYDRNWVVNGFAEPNSEKVFDCTMPMGFTTQFNAGTAGDITDIATNSVYLLVVGSVAAGATAGSVRLDCRLRFYDE